jgi:hypothetical protein
MNFLIILDNNTSSNLFAIRASGGGSEHDIRRVGLLPNVPHLCDFPDFHPRRNLVAVCMIIGSLELLSCWSSHGSPDLSKVISISDQLIYM